MKEHKLSIFILLVLLVCATRASGGQDTAKTRVTDRSRDQIPVSFEVNRGQIDSQVQFLMHGLGYTLFLTSSGAILTLHQPYNNAGFSPEQAHSRRKGKSPQDFAVDKIHIQLLDANRRPQIDGIEELSTRINYLRGSDSARWHTGIPTYAKVKYHQIYPGIDLIYYGNQRQLEYDFVVAPGADPESIGFSFEGVDSKPEVTVDNAGNLVLGTEAGTVFFRKPKAYQVIDGKQHTVEVQFMLSRQKRKEENSGVQVSFAIAPYDRTHPLIIDPVLSYSTYLGGGGADWGKNIAVDSMGNAYVTGETLSADLPTHNALYSGPKGDSDAFVAKLDTKGSAFTYITYLGGSYNDQGNAIAVDKAGNAFVTGQTWSSDFLARRNSRPGLEGNADAFVVKLTPDGKKIAYTTYLGGSDYDVGYGIAVDRSGSAYVTGETASADFPNHSPMRLNPRGGSDAFVAKITPNGTLTYVTYLEGKDYDIGYSIALDRAGNAYVTGETASADFPKRNAAQSNLRGGSDAFVAKIAANGRTLAYATYLGGSGFEEGSSIGVDSGGNAYVTGWTWSRDFPSRNALYPSHSGLKDAFVTKLDSSGKMVFATYLGGRGDDVAHGIAVDKSGNAYVVGSTRSSDFPTHNALYPSFRGDSDAFVVKLDSSGLKLDYATYLGGSGFDEGNGIAVDSVGNAYISGQTWSPDFPKDNALFPNIRSGSDVFVVKIAMF